MDHQLWNLFRETGEPMGYLLYAAEQKKTKAKREPAAQKKPRKTPPASG